MIIVTILFANCVQINAAASNLKNVKDNKKVERRILKNSNKLTIFNKKGKTIREISLKREERVEERIINKKRKNIKREIVKSAAVSMNNKYIGININENNLSEIDEEGNEKSYMGEGGGTGRFKLLNEEGNELWEKEFPEGIITYLSPEPLISDNGDVVVIQTKDTTGASISDKVYILDNTGNEVIVVPDEENKEDIRIRNIDKISQDGRYLAISIKRKKGPNRYVVRFINLKTKSHWDSEERLDVLSISNEGIAKVGYFDAEKGSLDIDLRNYIGE